MVKPLVAGIGELLWDVFPEGKMPGGAPANFAFHAFQYGCEAILISAVGNDQLGKELHAHLDKMNLNTKYIQQNSYPTGTVTVQRGKNGQPCYTIHENTSWDNIRFDREIHKISEQLDAVCYGTLGQRNEVSGETIQKVLSNLKPGCLKIFDINLRQHYYSAEIIEESLKQADILKLNDEELKVVAEMYRITGTAEEQLEQLVSRYKLKYLVYTLGANGSLILSADEKSFLNAPQVKVADTVGAGDSFMAVFTAGILQGDNLKTAHQKANKAAAFVCSQSGACPVFPSDLFQEL